MLLGGVPSSISQAPVASGAVTPSRNERSKAQTLCIRRNIYVSFATRFIITLVVVEVGCRASHLLAKNKNKKKVLLCFNFPNNKALLPTSFSLIRSHAHEVWDFGLLMWELLPNVLFGIIVIPCTSSLDNH